MTDTKPLLNFLFELGQLRRVTHEGWKLLVMEESERGLVLVQ